MDYVGYKRIEVKLKNSYYEILVGTDILGEIKNYIPKTVNKIGIVTQQNIGISVDLTGFETVELPVENSENAKSLSSVETICSKLAINGFHRNDLLIGIGGGVVTDLCGFVASVYNRGIRFINIPTTLLGQVDAAIGGKTGVNLQEGKNLVGSFWQPSAVICDLNTLQTLPEVEFSNGYGEIAKYSLIGVGDMKNDTLAETVYKCAKFKARVVADDEFELIGLRAILNYGHTLGHALELVALKSSSSNSRPELNHGQAVAVGIAFEAGLACRMGRIDEAELSYQLESLKSYSLPSAVPQSVQTTPEELVSIMAKDKKSTGALAFVLDGPNGVELVKEIDENLVLDTLSEFLECRI